MDDLLGRPLVCHIAAERGLSSHRGIRSRLWDFGRERLDLRELFTAGGASGDGDNLLVEKGCYGDGFWYNSRGWLWQRDTNINLHAPVRPRRNTSQGYPIFASKVSAGEGEFESPSLLLEDQVIRDSRFCGMAWQQRVLVLGWRNLAFPYLMVTSR
ncbi:uncharacterized protein N7500_008159 [Penicillium coprophilum]|uniref:uncharacterized protein n=1 Tax=Penicillium coprophilum TaxID=36646 RepID=UPI0023827242|nr:uncharacterized protein N7500_008159 [Penicillium coprophilum]KAJ5158508.1 hypothetical protein N7500_008159 [Penicillium coprophilum]